MRNIAIVPARSGSKALPNKNIKGLSDRPLISYSIVAALESHQFDLVMVSTDSEEYAEIARFYGAEVPFIRSEITSYDSASSWDTVFEVLDNYEKLGQIFDTFCLLQPTSPMRTAEDIISAYSVFTDKSASVAVSMTELEHPIAWCGKLGRDDSVENFVERDSLGRRQVQDKYYRPNGAIYIQNISDFIIDSNPYRDRSYAFIMPNERSIDIDTEYDFKLAEFLIMWGYWLSNFRNIDSFHHVQERLCA